VTPEIAALVKKARRSLAAARRLSSEGDHDFAASRAYYAMFYVAEALLLSRGLSFSKHSAVIAAFGQHFAKAGILPAEHHAALRTGFDQRNLGDYEEAEFPEEVAEQLLRAAQAFLDDAMLLLGAIE
jgi:uncharacterized protein (UPF0332 family)